ncbi:MAG: hypothetical protein WC479_12205 [Candidatus Izemoplasmatales bacterium]
MSVTLYLTMQDTGGYPLGKVRRIEAELNGRLHLYLLEPAFIEYDYGVCICEIWNGAMQLRLSHKVFKIRSYRKNATGLATNAVTVTDDVHADIFRYLRGMVCRAKDKLSGGYTIKQKWAMDDCLDEWLKAWQEKDNISILIDQGT